MSKKVNEALLRSTIDASVWASEFVKVHGGDEDLMIAWFANAIMAGYDEGQRRIKAEESGAELTREAVMSVPAP